MQNHKSAAHLELTDRAERVLPGGGFGNLQLDLVIREGRGGRVWDTEGRELVDYILGSGPMLVGHAHPEVVEAVREQIGRGTTFFANNEAGIQLAEDIVAAVPCAEKVRFTSTGTEATLYAMRVARAHRRRDKILKFEGGFHGMNDYALMSMAPKRQGNFPQAVADSGGIPHTISDDVLIAPFNDAETVVNLVTEHHNELAGVIVEPFQRLLRPRAGFLEALRRVTTKYEVPLIFDEIVTGFRFAYGGAQQFYGVTPDLCTLGKVIGGGFPLAAVVGSDELMRHFDRKRTDEHQFLPQIGTLNGNPVAAVAGLATLAVLRRPGAYEGLFETGRRLRSGLQSAMERAGIPASVIGEDPLFDVAFAQEEPRDYRSMARCDAAKLRRFNQLLLEHGVLKGETKFYLSLAHGEEEVETTLAAFSSVANLMADTSS